MLKIKQIELIEINMPLVHFFETSFGRTYERRIILTRVLDEADAEGWGECTAGETPSYCEEWTESCWAAMEKVLAPMVVGKEIETAENVWDLMRRVRGNRMAKAAIETAVWDLEAKKLSVPLWKHLGGTNREIKCGVSIGIQDSVEQLLEKIRIELDAGYQRIKIKIAPHWDYEVIKKVRETFGDIRLMGDANSAYTLGDIDKLKSLDEFDLMMLEQPLSCDDIVDHAKLQSRIKTPICLDEPIKSPDDARKAEKRSRRRTFRIKTHRKNLPRKPNSRLVRRNARIRHRTRSQYRNFNACGLYNARRCVRVQKILGGRHHRTGGRSFKKRNNHRARKRRNRF
jgi:o-succinylbenzoate synthase